MNEQKKEKYQRVRKDKRKNKKEKRKKKKKRMKLSNLVWHTKVRKNERMKERISGNE